MEEYGYMLMIAYFHFSVICIMTYIHFYTDASSSNTLKQNPMPGAHVFIGIDLVSIFTKSLSYSMQ